MNAIEIHNIYHHSSTELSHIKSNNCRYCVSERTKRYGNIYNNRLIETKVRKVKTQNFIHVLNVPIDENCSICLLPLEQQSVQLNKCRHCFHYNCMDKWLDFKLNCPMCRTKVSDIWVNA